MKRILLSFFFTIVVSYFGLAQGGSYCDKEATKISFTGKAPWSIDGKMDDWQTILGPYTGDNNFPFTPPQTSAFNWVRDYSDSLEAYKYDFADQPQPQSDLYFLSFTHDDYNVYFYLRRRAVDTSTNSFYYFLDINSDGVMSEGEPVVHGTFNNKSITDFTLSRYVVNKSVNYNIRLLRAFYGKVIEKSDYGNFMDDREDGAIREGREDPNGPIAGPIDKFPLSGSLVEVFNSASVPGSEKPKKGEVFAAALTEGGYGVELSVPIRYLRLWIMKHQKDKNQKGKGNEQNKIKYETTEPINLPTDIFFYHVSMQNNGGPYNPRQVVDNAGSCSGGVGTSGSPNVSNSIVTTVIEPGRSYKFDITYQNLVNKSTEVGVEYVYLYDSKDLETSLSYYTDYQINIYPDYNCNGKIDPGVDDFIDPSADKMDVVLPPLGKGCFIALLTIKPNRPPLPSFEIVFESSVIFLNGYGFCDPTCGSKPINQVGRVSTSVGTTTLSAKRPTSGSKNEGDGKGMSVYPNPSNGNVTVSLPQREGPVNVALEDYLGRSVHQWQKINSDRLQISNLKRGIYIVKVLYTRTGKMETKKIVVM